MNTSHIKNTKVSIDHKKINEMKKKINDLISTLRKCDFDKNWLESMFQNKQIPKDTTRAPWHTHRAHIYAKVYQCTHCSWKDHLTKFCYDRLNATNKHVWIHKTNTIELKKVWVPKAISISVDANMRQGHAT